jgi:hypothetical protein
LQALAVFGATINDVGNISYFNINMKVTVTYQRIARQRLDKHPALHACKTIEQQGYATRF